MELEFSPDRVERGITIGGFVVERRLGAGGFGIVVVVLDPTGTQLAMKLCKVRLADDRDAVTRFKREMAGLTLLDHPNIVAVHGHGYHPTKDGYPWLVTDLVEGSRLDHYVRGVRPSLKQLVALMAKVFAGVAYMHEHGLMHRDLKPSNIMVRESDHEPIIIDFGLVVIDAGETVTHAAVLAGTPTYLAPEQAKWHGSDSYFKERFESTPAVDVYALGVTLFELLTGRRPHEKTPLGLKDLLEAKVNVTPTRPDLLNSNVPGPLCDLVMALLASDPAARLTAAQALDQLEDLLASAPDNWDAPWIVPQPKGPQDGTVAARGQSSRSGFSNSRSPVLPPGPVPVIPTDIPSIASPVDPFAAISLNAPAQPATPNVVVDAALPARPAAPLAQPLPAPAPAVFDEASQRSFVSIAAPVAVDPAATQQKEDLAALIATARQLTSAAPAARAIPAGAWVLGALVVLILGFLAFASLTSTPTAANPGSAAGLVSAGPIAPAAAGLVTPPVSSQSAPAPREEAPSPPPTKTQVREPRGGSSRTKVAAAAVTPAEVKPAAAKSGNVDLFAGAAQAPASAPASRDVPAGARCSVELRGAVTAGEAPVPVSVLFRKACFQFGEREVVPESSTASGVATSKNGRLFIRLTELRVIGGGTLKVNAEAVQAGMAGISGTRALRAPRPAGAEAVETVGQVAQTAALSQLPQEAQQVLRSAKPSSQGAEQALEMVALGRGEQFQILFREVVQQ